MSQVKSRPLFLRLCVTAATPEALESRLKVLDINSSGARPAAMDADSVVQLEPGVNGFLDVAKTREVPRCHALRTIVAIPLPLETAPCHWWSLPATGGHSLPLVAALCLR